MAELLTIRNGSERRSGRPLVLDDATAITLGQAVCCPSDEARRAAICPNVSGGPPCRFDRTASPHCAGPAGQRQRGRSEAGALNVIEAPSVRGNHFDGCIQLHASNPLRCGDLKSVIQKQSPRAASWPGNMKSRNQRRIVHKFHGYTAGHISICGTCKMVSLRLPVGLLQTLDFNTKAYRFRDLIGVFEKPCSIARQKMCEVGAVRGAKRSNRHHRIIDRLMSVPQ